MNKNQLLAELDKRGVKLWVENDLLNIEAPKGILTPELRNSLVEHKQELIRLLRLSDTHITSLPRIESEPSKKFEPFPLTDIQQAHWIGRNSIFELGNVSNHIYIEFKANNLDLSRLTEAWKKLIERHDMLRAVVLPTGEQQVLEKVPSYEISILDLKELDKEEVDTHLALIREQLSHQSFSSQQWPWFDIRATYLDKLQIRLHLSLDLLMVDAASIRILFREWNQLYQNPDLLLPPLPLLFRDYVINKNALQDSQLVKRSRDYWLSRLDSLPPAPELPVTRFPSELKAYKFKRWSGKLEPHKWDRLKQQGKKAGLTPSIILLTAFSEVLSLWSKNPRFTLNLTVLDRLPFHPQINQIVGDFTNTTLLAIDNSEPNTFTARALQIQEQLLQDLDHLYISGVEILRELASRNKIGSIAAMPIVFSSVLGLNSFAKGDLEYNFLGELVYGISQTPQVSLEHQVTEQNGALVFNWDAIEELFPVGMLDDMFAVYCNLLERLAQVDELWRESIELLPPVEINLTHKPIPETALLHTVFFEQVSQRPQQKAIISADRILTYQELSDRVIELARQLGDCSETAIAIVMEKGWEQVVAALAILTAGAAYIPIDPQLPKQRRDYLLKNGNVKIILTQSWLDNSLEWSENVTHICIDSLTLTSNSIEFPIPPQSQNPSDLAYIIYTSGSTGIPKGVAINHRGALNTILDINERFEVNASDLLLALSSLSFDLSVYDIFGTLAAGGTIVIPDAARTKDPNYWSDLITKHQITIWNSVPALMQMLVEYASNHPEINFNTLRLVLLSGDWIPLNLSDRLLALSEKVKTISLGGATEASIWSIFYPIETVNPNWKSIPYGKPLKNQHFYVLNQALKICPVWVTGQLYIGGMGLANGYWQDEEKTNASFIIHPSNGERLYKTGDLGRYLPDGNIEFLGREDFQVKINGYRIELGEIEAALKQHPALKEAIAIAKEEKLGNKVAIAYLVAKSAKIPTPSNLRSFLQAKLPEYMIPSAFVLLESLPLTANGKINRQTLPEPKPNKPLLEKALTLPSNSVEKLLIATWTELLQIEQIGIHDNFFELGGHSFLALQLVSKINQKLGTNIPLSTLFQYPTVTELANFLIENARAWATPICLVPIQIKGTHPPLFCIHPAGGEVMVYRHLAAYLESERSLYALQSRALNNPAREHNSIKSMAVEYTKAIREHQPDGHYHLIGWSMGGVIAVSIAQELEQQGQKVNFVGLVDAFLFPDEAANFERDLLYELGLLFGSTFINAFLTLDALEQQKLRDELVDLTSSERLRRIVNWGTKQNLLSTAISLDILQKQQNLSKIHSKLLKAHEAPQISAQLNIWWASEQFAAPLARTDWNKYTTGATQTKILEGNHFTLMRPPYIKALAQELREIL